MVDRVVFIARKTVYTDRVAHVNHRQPQADNAWENFRNKGFDAGKQVKLMYVLYKFTSNHAVNILNFHRYQSLVLRTTKRKTIYY